MAKDRLQYRLVMVLAILLYMRNALLKENK